MVEFQLCVKIQSRAVRRMSLGPIHAMLALTPQNELPGISLCIVILSKSPSSDCTVRSSKSGKGVSPLREQLTIGQASAFAKASAYVKTSAYAKATADKVGGQVDPATSSGQTSRHTRRGAQKKQGHY